MKSTVIKPDSAIFNLVKEKIDTLINLRPVTANHPSIINNTVFSTCCTDISDPWWIFTLKYVVAPAFIVLFSVWLTGYVSRNKEYNRIIKLNSFVNVWLNNIVSGINDQIKLFAGLRDTYKSIEWDSPRRFDYANVDIKSVTEMPKADLYKLYISIRKGDEVQKSQNLYDLLFALNSTEEIIEDYRNKITELNERTIRISDDVFNAYRKLLDAEKEYVHIHIQTAMQNPNHRQSPSFIASQQYTELAIARQNYLQSEIGKTRTRRAVYFFSKKMADLCSRNLHLDQNLLQLLELNINLFQAILQLRVYYSKIRNNLTVKIAEMERMRDLIASNQQYFNNLKFVSKFKFKE